MSSVDSYHDRCLRILAPILSINTHDAHAQKKHAQVIQHTHNGRNREGEERKGKDGKRNGVEWNGME